MIGFLGTASLLVLVVVGVCALPAWLIIPMAVGNTFIGMHFPAEKAAIARARGLYTRILLSSFPLQLVFAALFYGVGRGVGWLFA
jgi:hypothetical protein